MTLYRKKPVMVEAYKWMPDHHTMEGKIPLPEWLVKYMIPNKSSCGIEVKGDLIFIHTLKGTMTAIPGDWIVKGVKGEIYPVKSDIFEATYEAVGI